MFSSECTSKSSQLRFLVALFFLNYPLNFQNERQQRAKQSNPESFYMFWMASPLWDQATRRLTGGKMVEGLGESNAASLELLAITEHHMAS
jgi:hypothetical protein